jgi:hypothetical protein
LEEVKSKRDEVEVDANSFEYPAWAGYGEHEVQDE